MSNDRDTFTDAGRGGGDQLQKRDVGYELSFAPITVAQEKASKGYNPGDTPTGAKKAAPLKHSGNRGAADERF